MGAPSQAYLHTSTDRIAALAAEERAGLASQLTAATNLSMWDQLDAVGDPAVVAALVAPARLIDDQALPANATEAFLFIANRSGAKGWFNALKTLVTSAAGGAYASVNAYLTAVSAQLHPLAAEIGRLALGPTGIQAASVFCPAYAVQAPARLYYGQDGSFADDTTDAGDVGTADVPLFAANSDVEYVGHGIPFDQLIHGLSTLASHNGNFTVKYWNGSSYTAVSGLTDGSTGLTKQGRIKWTRPTDWVRTYKDAAGNAFADKTPLYYLRLERVAVTMTTTPIATMARVVPALVYHSGTTHLGVPQPPLAIGQITAANTVSVEQICLPDTSRFNAPTLVLRALTPFAVNLTLLVSYLDQDGNAATQVQAEWVAPAAGDTVAVTLAGGDTGVTAVQVTGWTVVTAATSGAFAVEVAELRTPAK